MVCNCRRIGKDHRDHIEPDATPVIARARHESTGSANNMTLLLGIYSAIRAAKFRAGARFHLNEHKRLAITGDDVDLRISARPVIARDHGQAAAAEVAMCHVLPFAA